MTTPGPLVDSPYRMQGWLRVLLVVLHLAAVAGGLVVGTATYERWSEPDPPAELR